MADMTAFEQRMGRVNGENRGRRTAESARPGRRPIIKVSGLKTRNRLPDVGSA